MKFNKIFSAFMLIAAVAFTACNDNPPVVGPTGGDDDKPNTTDTTVVDTTGWNIPAGTLTVAQARELCNSLEADVATDKEYYVMGYVKKVDANGVQQYGNVTAYMIDKKGDTSNKEDFCAFQIKGLNGQAITNADAVQVGDFIVIYGKLVNYKGNTPETVGKGAAYIWKSSNPKLSGGSTDPGKLTGEGTRTAPYTCADVIALGSPNQKAWVKAYIVGQVKAGSAKLDDAEFTAPFTGDDNGNGTNLLLAATSTVTSTDGVIPVQLPSGDIRNALNVVKNESVLGQEILLYGSLEKYFSTNGIKTITYAEVSGNKYGIDPDVKQEEPEAKVVTIAEFIAAAESKEVYYEITGTIGGNINTTYGNFDLTDATGTVYVYGLTSSFIAVGSTSNDQSYASLGLKDGDNITIRGFRGSYNGKIEMMGAYFVKKN